MGSNRYIRQLLHGIIFKKNNPCYSIAKELEEANIIDIFKKKYIYCNSQIDGALCSEKIEVDTDEDYVICPYCGSQIDTENRTNRMHLVSSLNYNGALEYILEKINSLKQFRVKDVENGFIRIENQSGEYLLVGIQNIMSCESIYYSSFNYVYKNPILFLRMSSQPISHIIDNIKSLFFWDFYKMDMDTLEDKLHEVSISLDEKDIIRYDEINRKFDDFAENITWQEFENWTKKFIKHIKRNRKLVDKYLEKLQRDRNTLFGSIHVRIGGGGNTDIRLFDKYSYLKPLFYDRYILDSKNYSNRKLSQITRNHISKINLHKSEDPTRPEYAIAFCTTNNVQTTAWDSILKLKRNNGRWVIIIINKSLLIDILINVNGLYLLENL